ncbi:diguanylate cyclase [Acetobacterium carbinolicum]|uniref:sensor domain-containing diguanylate cyclase n=1 Tax=Acetobacterium carbinolicum TaxID=52690 RepID=UPI0039BF4446
MISKIITINTIEMLNEYVLTEECKNHLNCSASVFVQVFSAVRDPCWMMAIESTLRESMPGGVIVGATTMGEIAVGRLLINTTVISFAFLEKTKIMGFLVNGDDGNEIDLGTNFAKKIERSCRGIAGIMLLATPFTMDVSVFLNGFSAARSGRYPVFGGGAGDYEAEQEPLIALNGKCTSKGVLAVVFMGNDIQIDMHTYLGWQPLSKEMVITETDGLWVKKIDDEPAYEVFHRYLDIQNDEDFFLNVLEFPLLLKRNGILYAKVPMRVNEEKAIKFIAELKEGEKVCIGYGNPSVMIEKANDIQNRIQAFKPEAIFLYSCICRRYLLQSEVDLETRPFESIAPTSGFYTYGEIYSQGHYVMLLNATMVAVSMKERNGNKLIKKQEKRIEKPKLLDPFSSQHSQIISRLVNFIRVVTEELEQANAEARRLAERDYLTQAYNRMKAHAFIKNEIERCDRYDHVFSIIMLDMDFFKKVNDTFGHNLGDEILIHLVNLLSREIRTVDMLSRWGGEEFLIIMPKTDSDGAKITAERIRIVIEQTQFTRGLTQTCSFGVTAYKKGESIESMIDRVDNALYEAKLRGRNCVVTK